jgi:SagB-type dehydrogenase family enzyme
VSALEQLVLHGLLVEKGTVGARRDAQLARVWSRWLPEGSFHFATKHNRYVDPEMTTAKLIKLLPKSPPPESFKTYPDVKAIRLPPRQRIASEFVNVLLKRRTHRRFGSSAISINELADLLSLSWGITGYIPTGMFGRLPLKTSPSGGARHPVEVYVAALRVDGLEPGLYHYHAAKHRLEQIRLTSMSKLAERYCAGQKHAGKAAALFIMTAVFPRSMYKYHRPRAYRVVMLDAGHLAQTFSLVATWMRLAPFTTAALNDTLIEENLGIDGINESVLYVAGVGRPATGRT